MSEKEEYENEALTTVFTQWTSFLDKEHVDAHSLYRDGVSLQLEQTILNVQNDLMKNNPSYTQEDALKSAICIVMERMLNLQHEHFPKSMDNMVVALFTKLPGLEEVRYELLFKQKMRIIKMWIKDSFLGLMNFIRFRK